MNNKSLIVTCLLGFAGLGCAPGIHAADEPGWYAGAGAGQASVKKTSSWAQVTDATMLVSGFTTNTVIKSNDTAWKLFGGYQFNENFAVEGAYHDFGRFDGVTVVAAPASSTTGTWKAYAASVSAVGIYPLAHQFSVFGKIGLAGSRVKVDVPAPVPYSPSATRFQPLLGVGIKYDINKAIGLRAEFERFNNVGDGSKTGQSPINVWTVSGQYRF
jgi:OOP family OmpA-OmpF porin